MNEPPSDTVSPPAPIIHPRQIFTVEQARLALGLADSTLDREVRLGRLRCSMRGGRRWILGQWLLDWIKAGEVKRGARKHRMAEAAAN